MEPLSPWTTARTIVESLSWSDGAWIGIAIVGAFLFHSIAVRGRTSEEPRWTAVLFWLIAVVGWAFVLYMVALVKIAHGGRLAYGVLAGSALLVIFSVVWLTKRSALWERISSGVLLALCGYGILASFARGNTPIAYALLMGMGLGLILGMALAAARDVSFRTSVGELAKDDKGGASSGQRVVERI